MDGARLCYSECTMVTLGSGASTPFRFHRGRASAILYLQFSFFSFFSFLSSSNQVATHHLNRHYLCHPFMPRYSETKKLKLVPTVKGV
jgi:hypothetical protein